MATDPKDLDLGISSEAPTQPVADVTAPAVVVPDMQPEPAPQPDVAKQPDAEPDIELAEAAEPRIRKYVGVQISVAEADKHLKRPDVPEGCPLSALVIEGVCDIPWPAGVSWIDAVKAILNPTAK